MKWNIGMYIQFGKTFWPTVQRTICPTVRPTVRSTIRPTIRPPVRLIVTTTDRPSVQRADRSSDRPSYRQSDRPTDQPISTYIYRENMISYVIWEGKGTEFGGWVTAPALCFTNKQFTNSLIHIYIYEYILAVGIRPNGSNHFVVGNSVV